jgi:uncharacterized membrane protein YeaQ/YmgE (transglycosylase-associated protein family)
VTAVLASLSSVFLPLAFGFAAVLLGLSPGFAGFLITLLLGLVPSLVAPVLSGNAVRSRIGAAVVTFVLAVVGAAVGIAVFPLGSLAALFLTVFPVGERRTRRNERGRQRYRQHVFQSHVIPRRPA